MKYNKPATIFSPYTIIEKRIKNKTVDKKRHMQLKETDDGFYDF